MKNSILKAVVLGLGLAACDPVVNVVDSASGVDHRERESRCYAAKTLQYTRIIMSSLAAINPHGKMLHGDKTIAEAASDTGLEYAKASAAVKDDKECVKELRRRALETLQAMEKEYQHLPIK